MFPVKDTLLEYYKNYKKKEIIYGNGCTPT